MVEAAHRRRRGAKRPQRRRHVWAHQPVAAVDVGVCWRAGCTEIPSVCAARKNTSDTNTLLWSMTTVWGTITGLAAAPKVSAEISGGAVHPSVHRHTDGADLQDQTHPNADHHIGRINDGTTPRGRHPQRRSTHGLGGMPVCVVWFVLRGELSFALLRGELNSRAHCQS